MAKKKGDTPGDTPVANPGLRYLRHLLVRHGIPQQEDQVKHLQAAMQCSYHTALRRIIGAQSTHFDDLEKMARSFNETLDDVFFFASLDQAERATLRIGPFEEACFAWLGDAVTPGEKDALVASREPTGLVVQPASTATDGALQKVVKVFLEPKQASSKHIAVLDDDVDLAQSICDYLRATGFDARAFSELDSLREAIAVRPFDGYVLDWIVRSGTVRDLILDIRSNDSTCPIVVLTGKTRSGEADVAEFAQVVDVYDCMYFEKPAQSPIIAMRLNGALRRRSAANAS